MAPTIPHEIKAKLVAQMHMDPNLPPDNPTIPSWQEPPHSLAEARSENLPPVTDFAIIGSGITGCSVAKHLLDSTISENPRVTIFEARTLTSGATSRNGGFLISNIPKAFAGLVDMYGKDVAIQIARYSNRTVEKVLELASSEGPALEMASEIRKVDTILSFQEHDAFAEAVASIRYYEESVPEDKGLFSIFSKEAAEKVRPGSTSHLALVIITEVELETTECRGCLVCSSPCTFALSPDHRSLRETPQPLLSSFLN